LKPWRPAVVFLAVVMREGPPEQRATAHVAPYRPTGDGTPGFYHRPRAIDLTTGADSPLVPKAQPRTHHGDTATESRTPSAVDRMQPRFHESLEPRRAGGESTSGTSDGRRIVYHNPAAESKHCRLSPAGPRPGGAVLHGIAGRVVGGLLGPSRHGFEPSCPVPGGGRDVQSPVPGLAEK
jgi:hypothetical protein